MNLSKNSTNHPLIIYAFGRQTEIVGKLFENGERFLKF